MLADCTRGAAGPVCPVCVPAPPGVFLPERTSCSGRNVSAGCVSHTSVHSDCDSRAWGSGVCARVVLESSQVFFSPSCSPRALRGHVSTHSHPPLLASGAGDGGFVIEFGGVCYQDTYPMYLACILHVFRMYLDVIRSYTPRYTKIHQDTSRYICIYLFGYHGNVSYLGICILLYDTFKIH